MSPYISDRLSNKASLTPSRYRRYKGAIWTKNICFSINRRLNRESGHTMIFPASFAKDLSNRFIAKYPNHDLDYGMRSYKYTYTIGTRQKNFDMKLTSKIQHKTTVALQPQKVISVAYYPLFMPTLDHFIINIPKSCPSEIRPV